MKRLVVFKRERIIFFVMIYSTLILTSCVEDMTLPPLEAQFQLLDASDSPTISFREGEDILFDYRIFLIQEIRMSHGKASMMDQYPYFLYLRF